MMWLKSNLERRNRESLEIKNLVKQEWGRGWEMRLRKSLRNESLKKKQIEEIKISKRETENVRGPAQGMQHPND